MSLTKKGYKIAKECVDFDIISDLTVTPLYNPNVQIKPSSFCLYKESENNFFVPRYYGTKKFGDPNIKIQPGIDCEFAFNGTLREQQQTIVDMFISKQSGIICLGCGGGKTICALNIISQIGKKALVVCNKDFLINQWKERITHFLPSSSIGLIKRDKVDIENKDIVLASLQSLAMKDYEPEIFKDFGIVIYDECHHLGAEVFSRAMAKTYCLVTLGLSATLKRKDGLSKVIEWYLGDVVFAQSNQQKVETNIHIHTYSKDGKVINDWRGKPIVAKMINNLCEDIKRNEFIIQKIMEAFKDNRQIIVLSSRREHLKLLFELLTSQITSDDVGYFVGGMKEIELKKSESKKIILATYTMAAEALDIPSLNTLVLASPMSSIEQAVGRIQRNQTNTIIPLVIDIWDEYSIFMGQCKKRMSYYKQKKYLIEKQ